MFGGCGDVAAHSFNLAAETIGNTLQAIGGAINVATGLWFGDFDLFLVGLAQISEAGLNTILAIFEHSFNTLTDTVGAFLEKFGLLGILSPLPGPLGGIGQAAAALGVAGQGLSATDITLPRIDVTSGLLAEYNAKQREAYIASFGAGGLARTSGAIDDPITELRNRAYQGDTGLPENVLIPGLSGEQTGRGVPLAPLAPQPPITTGGTPPSVNTITIINNINGDVTTEEAGRVKRNQEITESIRDGDIQIPLALLVGAG